MAHFTQGAAFSEAKNPRTSVAPELRKSPAEVGSLVVETPIIYVVFYIPGFPPPLTWGWQFISSFKRVLYIRTVENLALFTTGFGIDPNGGYVWDFWTINGITPKNEHVESKNEDLEDDFPFNWVIFRFYINSQGRIPQKEAGSSSNHYFSGDVCSVWGPVQCKGMNQELWIYGKSNSEYIQPI